jgi:hypothetical protein
MYIALSLKDFHYHKRYITLSQRGTLHYLTIYITLSQKGLRYHKNYITLSQKVHVLSLKYILHYPESITRVI